MHPHRRWRGVPAVRRRTMRVRLTALYTGIFLVTSTLLVIVVNLEFSKRLQTKIADIAPAGRDGPAPPPLPPPDPGFGGVTQQLQEDVLQYQWVVTAITVAVLAVLSIVAGWWMAGRMLRPLRRITATARRLSLS